VLTDNKNRAAADVRNLFSKNGGNLGATGSVSYMFKRLGQIEYDASTVNEDEIMEVALEAGADDVANDDGVITVTTDPVNFEKALETLQAKGYESLSAEISMVPDIYSTLDVDTTRKVLKLIDKLEENDDVQNVYSNIEIPEGFEE
jgi:YebC/PmpR family DNA-binding regulatory protein